MGPYVLDFYCPALKLAVEVDGAHHETQWVAEYDDSRASYLERRGILIVRITNELLAKDSWLVEEVIGDTLARRLKAVLPLAPLAGRGMS